MSSITPSPIGPATTAKRGTMSAADKSKLDAYPATPTVSAVEAVTEANGLDLTTGTLSLAAAGAAQAGAVTTGAQEFGGAKTLTGAILAGVTTITEAVVALVRAVGVSLVLRSSLGAGASDKCVVVGSSDTDANVNASAKVWVAATGIGGTQVDKVWVDKAGNIRTVAGGRFRGSSASGGYIGCDDSAGASMVFGTNTLAVTSALLSFTDTSVGGVIFKMLSSGAVSWRGNDRSATIGADTQNRPTGINTIASGATTCRITNNLVPDPATTKACIRVEWRGDHGAARHWVVQGNGYFDVTLSAAAGGDTSFDWAVTGLS